MLAPPLPALRRILIVALAVAAIRPASARPTGSDADSVARQAGRPGWLAEVEPDLSAPTPGEREGAGYHELLYEQQVRVTDDGHQQWVRRAMRVLTSSGASALGTIEIEYRPGGEALALHQVTIHRDGRKLQRLADVRVTEAVRQNELSSNILDDTVTAVVLVPDLRVGDVLDYAFSRENHDPLMKGHASLYFPLQVGGPIAHIYGRLLWSADRPFQTRAHVARLEPTVRQLATGKEMIWERRDVSAETAEPYTPRDVFTQPWVEVSDFASWSDVVDWALPLYRRERTREIRSLARTFKTQHDTVAARALAALRFVQDEIRYLGLEWGIHSHTPHSPSEVLDRRYGDCKDKVLLLLSLFDELGVEAAPALVDMDDEGAVAELLPSPYAFDHAIVWANVPGVGEVWVDPTSTDEGGSIADAAVSYGRALIIRAGETELAVVPAPAVERVEIEVEEHYDLKARVLSVTSTYRGLEADAKRSYFRSTPTDEVVDHYLNFYGEELDPLEVEMLQDPETTDDREANVFVVREKYSLFGSKPEEFTVRAHTISTFLGDPPPQAERKNPFHLGGPTRVRHTIRVVDWETPTWEDARYTVEAPAVTLDVDHRVIGDTAALAWELRRVADRIPPGQAQEYMDAWDEIDAELTVVPSESADEPEGVVGVLAGARSAAGGRGGGSRWWLWLVVGGAAAAFLLFVVLRRRRSFRRRVAPGVGESATTALTVSSLADIPWAQLRPCTCGSRLSPELDSETTTARLGEAELTVLRLTCERCSQGVVRYLALAETSGELARADSLPL